MARGPCRRQDFSAAIGWTSSDGSARTNRDGWRSSRRGSWPSASLSRVRHQVRYTCTGQSPLFVPVIVTGTVADRATEGQQTFLGATDEHDGPLATLGP